MPIIRYFVFVSTLLLALLFAAECYLPAPAIHTSTADPDKTIIRIQSARKLPEKVVFDTNDPTITKSMVSVAEESETHPRDAFAAMTVPPMLEMKHEKQPHARKVAEDRSRAKRARNVVGRRPDRQLAFNPFASFGSGW